MSTFPEPVKLDGLFETHEAGAEFSFTRLNHNDEYKVSIENGNTLVLKTPYDKDLIGRIKIPAFGYGTWESERKVWGFRVYRTNIREAVRLLTDFGFVFGADVTEELRRVWG